MLDSLVQAKVFSTFHKIHVGLLVTPINLYSLWLPNRGKSENIHVKTGNFWYGIELNLTQSIQLERHGNIIPLGVQVFVGLVVIVLKPNAEVAKHVKLYHRSVLLWPHFLKEDVNFSQACEFQLVELVLVLFHKVVSWSTIKFGVQLEELSLQYFNVFLHHLRSEVVFN